MSLLVKHLSKDRLRDMVDNISWYHTYELPNGLKSRGTYDHAPVLSYYGFPDSLGGKKVLDVGASDGFFSFEFERRGAQSVLAIDTNKYDGSIAIDPSPAHIDNYHRKYSPDGEFSKEYSDVLKVLDLKGLNRLLITKDLIGSKVEFRNMSVYELNSLNQKHEFVFCGSLIEHLKNPLLALENLAAVTGELCVIALSSALPSSKLDKKLLGKILRNFIRLLGLSGDLTDTSNVIKYMGNYAGGSFFHFHPSAFKETLLASSFKTVNIYHEFDLFNLKWGSYNHHVIFHCYV